MRLNEIESKPDDITFIKQLHKDCAPFFNLTGGFQNSGILWRGSDIFNKNYTTPKTARLSNRHPADTPLQTHKNLNDYFTNNHGKPWRNAVFVTGNKRQALEFGAANIVLPVGNFEYLWNPHVVDMLHILHKDAFRVLKINIDHTGSLLERYNAALAKLFDFFDKHPYQSDNLGKAVKSGNEIMVWCDKYYMIPEKLFERLQSTYNETKIQ